MTVVRAKESFSYQDVNGVPVMVSAGALFDDADPDVKKRAHLFEEPEVAAARRRRRNAGVEDATAEPGEKRSLSTTRRSRRDKDDKDESQGDAGTSGS